MESKQVILWTLLVSGLSLFHSSRVNCEPLDRDALFDNVPDEVRFVSTSNMVSVMEPEFVNLNKMFEREKKNLNLLFRGPKTDQDQLDILKKFERNWPQLNPLEWIAGNRKQIKQPKRALVLINELARLKDHCNYKYYVPMAKVYRVLIEDTKGSLDGLKTLLLNLMKEHGDNCRAEYLSRFKQVSLDGEVRDRIDRVLTKQFVSQIIGSNQNSVVRVKGTIDRLSKLNQSRDCRIPELFEPCKDYVRAYKDIFFSAKLDLALDADKLNEINPNNDSKFMDTWSKFHVCSIVTNNKNVLELGMKDASECDYRIYSIE